MSTPGPEAVAETTTGSRRSRWWLLALGTIWLLVCALLLVSSWSVLWAGHPAHLVALGLGVLVGIALLAWGGLAPARRQGLGRVGRVVGRIAGGVLTLLVLGSLVWLRPFAADAVAVTAMTSGEGLRVVDSSTRILIEPADGSATKGLVFQPGARVDPRAYVRILREVSRSGVVVVVVKQPFDIGFLAIGAPASAVADISAERPQVRAWATGGHSLGGVAASSYAADHPGQVAGLALWASYPLGSLADRADLQVASVSGTNDGLATPADIAASKANLPASAAYTAVEGGVHAFFGDYGAQPGDGQPGVPREEAQRQIVAATVDLLDSLRTP